MATQNQATRLLEVSSRLTSRARPLAVGELLIVLVLVRVYDYIRSLEAVRESAALSHAVFLMRMEGVLHLGFERPANLWLTSHPWLSTTASWWYQLAHFGVTLSVLTACYLLRPNIYRRARNALVGTNVAGLLVFLVLPVAPPRLVPDAGFVDSVAQAGFGVVHSGPVRPDQYAAFPSLHLAWAAWTAVVVAAMLPPGWWRRWMALYPLATAVVVVTTANHFVLDVVAGVFVALVSARCTGLVTAGRPPFAALAASARPRQPVDVRAGVSVATAGPVDQPHEDSPWRQGPRPCWCGAADR